MQRLLPKPQTSKSVDPMINASLTAAQPTTFLFRQGYDMTSIRNDIEAVGA